MEASGTGTETSSDGESADKEPTPQPEALRQQQRYAAIAGSVLAGGAVTISIIQRFPEYVFVAVLVGVLSGLLVYRLARNSIFDTAE